MSVNDCSWSEREKELIKRNEEVDQRSLCSGGAGGGPEELSRSSLMASSRSRGPSTIRVPSTLEEVEDEEDLFQEQRWSVSSKHNVICQLATYIYILCTQKKAKHTKCSREVFSSFAIYDRYGSYPYL